MRLECAARNQQLFLGRMKSRALFVSFLVCFAMRSWTQSVLPLYDLQQKKPATVFLPKALDEISGLAYSSDGKLFAHDDEESTIYQIDEKSGSIVKKFFLKPKVFDDFEGIAIARGKLYLVTSNGDLYEFAEGKNDERVSYNVYHTDLKKSNDVEGLCYDPATNALLLACKDFPGKGYDGNRSVYAFSLRTMKLEMKPRVLLPLANIETTSRNNVFKPSGIERHPMSGTFFVLAANGESIVEVSKDGAVLGQMTFPKNVHPQAEGITFSSDNTLIISNEAASGRAKLLRYPMKKK